jgi:hypothetical protein
MRTVKWFDTEEQTVLGWAVVGTSFGVLFWLLARTPCNYELSDLTATILLGAGSGALAATVAQSIQRRIREQAQAKYFGSYAGEWKRVLMYQYRYLDRRNQMKEQLRITEAEAKTSEVNYQGGQRLHLIVRYDESRGVAASAIDFPGLDAHVGAGTYFYIEGELSKATDVEGLPHHGRFTMHLNPKEPDTIILLYDGLIPDPNVRGYEVWRRVKSS